MTVAWVLGSGGLLGSALCRALSLSDTLLFSPPEPFSWRNEATLFAQLAEAVRLFSAATKEAGRWEIYWAAGKGILSSLETELPAQETRILAHLVCLIKADTLLMNTPGGFAFASSAGAVYTGLGTYLINEYTPPDPITAYGREKLRQEELLNTLGADDITVLLARISTLYGTGQSLGKKQGLISHMARCLVRNKTVQIYVPLDTIRDYITADDAAEEIILSLRLTGRQEKRFIKIIASEQPTTIAQIIATFKLITRRSPRIVTSSNTLSSLYSRCVRFESFVEPCRNRPAKTSLIVGIAKVIASETKAMAQGGV